MTPIPGRRTRVRGVRRSAACSAVPWRPGAGALRGGRPLPEGAGRSGGVVRPARPGVGVSRVAPPSPIGGRSRRPRRDGMGFSPTSRDPGRKVDQPANGVRFPSEKSFIAQGSSFHPEEECMRSVRMTAAPLTAGGAATAPPVEAARRDRAPTAPIRPRRSAAEVRGGAARKPDRLHRDRSVRSRGNPHRPGACVRHRRSRRDDLRSGGPAVNRVTVRDAGGSGPPLNDTINTINAVTDRAGRRRCGHRHRLRRAAVRRPQRPGRAPTIRSASGVAPRHAAGRSASPRASGSPVPGHRPAGPRDGRHREPPEPVHRHRHPAERRHEGERPAAPVPSDRCRAVPSPVGPPRPAGEGPPGRHPADTDERDGAAHGGHGGRGGHSGRDGRDGRGESGEHGGHGGRGAGRSVGATTRRRSAGG